MLSEEIELAIKGEEIMLGVCYPLVVSSLLLTVERPTMTYALSSTTRLYSLLLGARRGVS